MPLADEIIGKQKITAAEAIVKFIKMQYSQLDSNVQRVIAGFLGIFGHGNVTGIGQALFEHRQDMAFIQGYNEQSLVHTAVAYARAKKRASTLAVTTSIGPGATNLVTGASLATINRLPVLLLPADIYATRHQGPVLQQLEHPSYLDYSVNEALRPVSRFFDRITRPEQLLESLPEAIRLLLSETETGAVCISLCQDVATQSFEYPSNFFSKRIWKLGRRIPRPEDLDALVSMILASKYPLMIVGGGIFYADARDELEEFANLSKIVVAETFAGKGAMKSQSWLSLGGIGVEGNAVANEMAKQADLVISIGTRLSDFITGSRSLFQNPNVRFVSINVCSKDAHKMGAYPIIGDAKLTLKELSNRFTSIAYETRYADEISRLRDKWNDLLSQKLNFVSQKTMTGYQALDVINHTLDDQDCIVAASGSLPGDILKAWQCNDFANAFIEFGYSCMGFELAGAIGLKLAFRKREVFALLGDGAFFMLPSELLTAVSHNIKINLVVFQNYGFQCIRRLQVNRGGTTFGNEFIRREKEFSFESIDQDDNNFNIMYPDISLIAKGMGAITYSAKTKEELKDAINHAKLQKNSCVIVCEIEPYENLPDSGAWWDIAPLEISNDPNVVKARAEYEIHKSKQRYYG
jgi:3D-(3,5/4)-trihydroxycyclohexane-1,2-dione acylhydrolase (decyclizing)